MTLVSYRDKIFAESLERGRREYEPGDVDWLFMLKTFKIKNCLIIGDEIRAGALYLSRFCEKLFVIVKREESFFKLSKIAAEEKRENVFFMIGEYHQLPIQKNVIDYIAGYTDFKREKELFSIFSAASYCMSGNGVINFSYQGWGRYLSVIESSLRKSGFKFVELFWVCPDVSQPTWAGNLNEKKSVDTLIEILDSHNAASFLPLWVRSILFSSAGKKVLKFLWAIFYPLRRLLFREYHIVASNRKAARPDFFMPQIGGKPFVKKSKASKEGKVLFFTYDKSKRSIEVLYFQRFPEYNKLLENELNRNKYTDFPVSPGTVSGGREILISDFIKGTKLAINKYSFDEKTIQWLLKFQEKTFLRHWQGQNWQRYISERTFGSGDIFAERFLRLIEKKNKKISMVAEHGDFDYLNVLKVGDKRCVLDWEYYNAHGDEFFDFSYFLLNIYTETGFKKNVPLKKVLRTGPCRAYVDLFMGTKGLDDMEIMLISIIIAALRIKHQSAYYTSMKDERYWMLDDILNQIKSEV